MISGISSVEGQEAEAFLVLPFGLNNFSSCWYSVGRMSAGDGAFRSATIDDIGCQPRKTVQIRLRQEAKDGIKKTHHQDEQSLPFHCINLRYLRHVSPIAYQAGY